MPYKNWEWVDFQYLNGNPPKYLSPILYKSIFAVKVASPMARDTWKFGGWAKVFSLGSNFPGGDKVLLNQERLPLGDFFLIRLDSNMAEYCQIEIDFPRWILSVEVTVWQAEQVEELKEELEEVKLKLTQVNFQEIIEKLDNLPEILLP